MMLKDGSNSSSPRLDRLVEFDEASRNYRISPPELGPRPRPRSYTWRLNTSFVIDQGDEGACVGFAVTNELQARPVEVRFGDKHATEAFARERIYWPAQRIDPWPGGSYPGGYPRYEGTSVLAGVKAAKLLGYFEEYRWAFGIEDLVVGLGRNGPAVLGLNWYSGMLHPDKNNFIWISGSVLGGHAILARAVTIRWKHFGLLWWRRGWDDVDLDRSYVTLRNSWGEDYGDEGDCYMSLSELSHLLNQQGEAVFFLKRSMVM